MYKNMEKKTKIEYRKYYDIYVAIDESSQQAVLINKRYGKYLHVDNFQGENGIYIGHLLTGQKISQERFEQLGSLSEISHSVVWSQYLLMRDGKN